MESDRESIYSAILSLTGVEFLFSYYNFCSYFH
jgi:hypothetical protein